MTKIKLFDDPTKVAPSAEEHAKLSYPAIPEPSENLADIVACLNAIRENIHMLTKVAGPPERFAVTFSDLEELGLAGAWVLDYLRRITST